ncbi:MAG TPA: hypothetical protein DDW34_05055 [Clostridium sp.]|nr:hypothetical protein [Clostridium sp.]
MLKVYHELLTNCGKNFDGILTLFAVTESSRGFGVGKKLVTKLCDYLKSTKQIKFIYILILFAMLAFMIVKALIELGSKVYRLRRNIK